MDSNTGTIRITIISYIKKRQLSRDLKEYNKRASRRGTCVIFIEKSKRRMIAEDITAAMELCNEN
jgi:hypothetical protein